MYPVLLRPRPGWHVFAWSLPLSGLERLVVAVAALVDRLVHHAEVLVLRGDSCRSKGKGKDLLDSCSGE